MVFYLQENQYRGASEDFDSYKSFSAFHTLRKFVHGSFDSICCLKEKKENILNIFLFELF